MQPVRAFGLLALAFFWPWLISMDEWPKEPVYFSSRGVPEISLVACPHDSEGARKKQQWDFTREPVILRRTRRRRAEAGVYRRMPLTKRSTVRPGQSDMRRNVGICFNQPSYSPSFLFSSILRKVASRPANLPCCGLFSEVLA